MAILKVAKRTVRNAKKTYKKGARLAGKQINKFMKPTTKLARRAVRKLPAFGSPLSMLASMPRRVTRAGTNMMVDIPNTTARVAGSVARTGGAVIKRVMFDPFLASGLLPIGRIARKTTKVKRRPTKANAIRRR